MPLSIRKDDKAKRIVTDLLGEIPGGNRDAYGKKKRYTRKRKPQAWTGSNPGQNDVVEDWENDQDWY